MKAITVGRYLVLPDDAEQIVKRYLGIGDVGKNSEEIEFFSWPYYDGFESGSQEDELNDGDLLAPLLLNVNPRIRGFAGLQDLRPHLTEALGRVPTKVHLADATADDMKVVSDLFSVLDEHPTFGVSGTTLSKVLHRKRPKLIPLHDKHVYDAYIPDRVARSRRRSWSDYMLLLMQEMQSDLRGSGVWRSLSQMPGEDEPPLTPLRALDIVVWTIGAKATKAR